MFSQVILRRTGLLLPVGSGIYCSFTDIIVSSINRNVYLKRLLLLQVRVDHVGESCSHFVKSRCC